MFGPSPYLGFARLIFGLFVMFGGPVLISWYFLRFEPKGQYHRRLGLFGGLAVAAWATACWFAVPYCGAYVQPAPMLVAFAFQLASPADNWAMHLTVIVVNFAFWPILGALYDPIVSSARPTCSRREHSHPG